MTTAFKTIPNVLPPEKSLHPQTSQLWSIYVIKGGIGKSTLTANMAFTLRIVNPTLRVCLVNADSTRVPQQCLGIGRQEATPITGDLYDVLDGSLDWQDVRLVSPFGVDVIPLGPNRAEAGKPLNADTIRQFVSQLKTYYDVILVDLHPGGQALLPWLAALDSVILPATLNANGVEAVLDTLDNFQTWKRQGYRIPDVEGVLVNKWNGRKRVSKVWLDRLEQVIPLEWLLPWPVRETTLFEQAESAWQPMARESSDVAQEVSRVLQLIARRWLSRVAT